MRKYSLIFVILVLASFMYAQERYSSGKISFIKLHEISEEKLPKDVFFQIPISIALHRNQDVFVCDSYGNDIKKFDSTGKFIKLIGKKGQGPGDLYLPTIITVSDDRLIVWEELNRRISIFTLDGGFIRSVKFSGDEGLPKKIKTLPNNDLVIELEKRDYDNEPFPQNIRINLYSKKLDFIKTICSKSVLRSKQIIKPGRADIYQPFNPDIFWDVSPEGKIIIGYSKNYIIDVYDPIKGKLYSFNGKYNPIKITEADKINYFAKMNIAYLKDKTSVSMKEGAPNFIIDETDFPKQKPAFDNILCDSSGNIWVHKYHSNREQEDSFFDVFSSSGNYINTVEIKDNVKYPFRRTKIVDDVFWIIIPDDEGNRIITKFKIKSS